MKMKFMIVCFLVSSLSIIARAQGSDGNIRQGVGVVMATAELATMDLIKVCLGLGKSNGLTFDGIENLSFFTQTDGSILGRVECVYKPVSK